MMLRPCEWCQESVAFFDAQTSSGMALWHTRCWNEAAAERARRIEEYDDNPTSLMTGPDDARAETARSEEITPMAAPTTTNRPLREVVDFALNVPVTVALKYNQGKTVSSKYGERVMFSLVDGRVMFLDFEAAGQIASLGVNVRESFTITRKPNGSDNSPTWEIARAVGEQPDGTFVLPATPVATASAPKPPGSASSPVHSPGSNALITEANSLVDAYAQVLDRALTTYQGRIKPDEARALLITAYIQRSKLAFAA